MGICDVVKEEIITRKEIKGLIEDINRPQSQNNDNNSNLKIQNYHVDYYCPFSYNLCPICRVPLHNHPCLERNPL